MKRLKLSKNVFYKCVLEFNFSSINGSVLLIFSKKVKIVLAYCPIGQRGRWAIYETKYWPPCILDLPGAIVHYDLYTGERGDVSNSAQSWPWFQLDLLPRLYSLKCLLQTCMAVLRKGPPFNTPRKGPHLLGLKHLQTYKYVKTPADFLKLTVQHKDSYIMCISKSIQIKLIWTSFHWDNWRQLKSTCVIQLLVFKTTSIFIVQRKTGLSKPFGLRFH